MKDHSEKARAGRSAVVASDAERNAVIARLNQACGEGLLSLREFSERVEDAQVVRTRAELDELIDDLPAQGDAPEIRTQWHVAAMGGLRRHGRWHMDRHLVSLAVIGGTNLDLREADIAAPEVTLTKISLLGGVSVCVPRGVRVVLERRGLLGALALGLLGSANGADGDECGQGDSDVPTVRVRAFSLLGGVTVQEPPLRHSA
ncbi:DUF1707 SHOCT-like domain-containing protein [Actinomadura rudentiformis]|uniref:DUF1707 domain-containing protein n=1 Tax=Actinomadura rudentiformis TaxID=359158 RepID=A0A6H9YMS3_9ACTN|nr:DUF1707 domain-containing protein [Actinomadura rudentiformis]KAB2344725.1 DUF1707 domain-containing protein [Actinomadura rudentiformis]